MKKKLMAWTMSLCVCAGLAGGTGAVSVWAAEDNTSAEDTQSDAVQETGEESREETADPDAVRVEMCIRDSSMRYLPGTLRWKTPEDWQILSNWMQQGFF